MNTTDPQHGAQSAPATQAFALVSPHELALPTPVFRGAQMAEAVAAYRDLQRALDASMPDQLMTLKGKPFRKKGYWRAVAVAFNLTVEPVTGADEERSVVGRCEDDTENYVYTVTYRATALNGRVAMGDGTCAAAEKQTGEMRATEHNVRSHAHTRAFNRAVSNLVGFGEVSAEEVVDEHRSTVQPRADGSALVTEIAPRTGTSKAGKPWTMVIVTFDDGRSGSTFSESLAASARQAQDAGVLVRPTLEQQGQYWNLTALEPITEPTMPAPALGEIIENGDPTPGKAHITEQEVRKFHAIARGHGWTDDERHDLLTSLGVNKVEEIPAVKYLAVLEHLKARVAK